MTTDGKTAPSAHLEKTVTYAAIATMGAGIGMLVAAMAIPPPGEIHNSILVAFGEISTFSATLLGVYRLKTSKS